MCEVLKIESSDIHLAIARHGAGLIDDGAVIQTGIGGIPDAVLPCLMDRKDLAVHSELVSDASSRSSKRESSQAPARPTSRAKLF